MSKLKVESVVKTYEYKGPEVTALQAVRQLSVQSHWNRKDFVVIKIGDDEYTVVASDLQKAITNATNS